MTAEAFPQSEHRGAPNLESTPDPFANVRAAIIERFELPTEIPDPLAQRQKTGERWERRRRDEADVLRSRIHELTSGSNQWKGMDTGLVRAAIHVLQADRWNTQWGFREDSHELSVVVPADSGHESYAIRVTPTPEHGELDVRIWRRKLNCLTGVLAEPDAEVMGRTLGAVMGMSDLRLQVDRYRPSGMTSYGTPAEFVETTLAGRVGDRSELLAFLNAERMTSVFEEAVDREIERIVRSHTEFERAVEGEPLDGGQVPLRARRAGDNRCHNRVPP